MNNRENAINFAINLIYTICEESDIALLPMEKEGINFVGIYDNTTGKEYIMLRNKEALQYGKQEA